MKRHFHAAWQIPYGVDLLSLEFLNLYVVYIPVTSIMAVQIDHQEQYRRVSQRVVFKFGGTVVGKFAPEIARICLYIVSPTSSSTCFADFFVFSDQASFKSKVLPSFAPLGAVRPKLRVLPIGTQYISKLAI